MVPPMRLVLALLAALIGLVLPATAPADRNVSRAVVAYRTMERTFHDPSSGLYRETAQMDSSATAWPYSQAVSAAIALSKVPRVGKRYVPVARRHIAELERYARTDGAYAPVVGGSNVYFDDNEWIALDLLDWHDRTGAAQPLARAKSLFKLVAGAWDGDESHPCAGGVFWTTAPGNRDRNTVTTATGALLAMRLFEATRDKQYVQWAQKMLAWVEHCMAAPNGLFSDHIDLDGKVDTRQWSYNQGTALGAYVLLYRLTGDEQALQRAEDIAARSLAQFDLDPLGPEPPFFLAIFFRNLLTLEQIDRNQSYRTATQAYADAVWDRLRDPHTGTFAFRASGPATLLEHASIVQMYAALATGR
jgi:hypothetical protein